MIAIVDYKAGNLTSVQRALEFLGHKSEITDRAERIVAADRVILPGTQFLFEGAPVQPLAPQPTAAPASPPS